MKLFYIILIVSVLLVSCDTDEVCKGCYDSDVRYYLYNNSISPVEIVGYSSQKPDAPDYKFKIPANELKQVGYVEHGKVDGRYFDSYRTEIYSDGKLVYYDFTANFTKLFETSEHEFQGYNVSYILFTAPVFKWCGNELCSD